MVLREMIPTEVQLARMAELNWLNELSKRGAAFVSFPPPERRVVTRPPAIGWGGYPSLKR